MCVYYREIFRRKKCGFFTQLGWLWSQLLSVFALLPLTSAVLLTLHLGGAVQCLEQGCTLGSTAGIHPGSRVPHPSSARAPGGRELQAVHEGWLDNDIFNTPPAVVWHRAALECCCCHEHWNPGLAGRGAGKSHSKSAI